MTHVSRQTVSKKNTFGRKYRRWDSQRGERCLRGFGVTIISCMGNVRLTGKVKKRFINTCLALESRPDLYGVVSATLHVDNLLTWVRRVLWSLE